MATALHRFVLLHHTGIPDPHFDLMIETTPGGSLMTWRCAVDPFVSEQSEAEKIQDHRAAYLTLECEISGGRGQVRRICDGAGLINSLDDNGGFELSPVDMAAITLRPTAGEKWRIGCRVK